MGSPENLLNKNEIDCLDFILSGSNISSLDDYSIEFNRLVSLLDDPSSIHSLKVKGIININNKESFKRTIHAEDEHPVLNQDTISIVTLDSKKLIETWIMTVGYNAGKRFNNFSYQNHKGNYNVIIEGIEENYPSFVFITKKINDASVFTDNEDKIFISFFSNTIIQQDKLTHWDLPLEGADESSRFFKWTQESIKTSYNKLYNYINIPKDLDESNIEGIISSISNYLFEIGYKKTNDSHQFKPEASEYLIPTELIREVFISTTGEHKIFLLINHNRFEIHSFINGVKRVNDDLIHYIEKLDFWIENKIDKHRKIQLKIKHPILTDIKQFIGLFLIIIIPASTSFMVLFKSINNFQDIFNHPILLTIHVVSAVLIIIVILWMGIGPHILYRRFSWFRGIRKQAKKDKHIVNS